ncbi:hypothetical protein, partial [Clostridium sp.]|uniref:hypothetical protein n=1 Tax=Clostridium sp. TaxID=1506 RepID=UPI00261797E6
KAVYAPTRTTVGRLTFEIIDIDAFEDNTKSASSEASISLLNQVTNKTREMTTKYATFENDYWKLDGSFAIPPMNTENGFEVGWWSNSLCDTSGIFNNESITITFNKPHSSIGLTIAFDIRTNEYAKDFDIKFYKLDGNLINTYSIIDNTEVLYTLDTPISNYGKAVIVIKKWCTGNRRARIKNIDFGIIKQYQDRELINMNIIEQVDVLSDIVPSNEIKFTIDNSSKSFNILNPNGVYSYLQERQEVKAELGIVLENNNIEYIPMGKYYLCDWQTDDNSITASFTARDILNSLEDIPYTILEGGTLFNIAKSVLNTSGITEYKIDEKLKYITSQGFKEKLSCKRALQYIALASRAVVFQDRYGKLIIRQVETLDASINYMTFCGMDGVICGSSIIEVNNQFDMKSISLENSYNVPKIKLDNPVKYLTIVLSDKTEVVVNNSNVINGVSYKIENQLINTEEQATEIAKWMFQEMNLRASYEVNWRQNPCLECGDIVLVEDGFNSNKQSKITKQEFNYNGYLSGSTGSKGGV